MMLLKTWYFAIFYIYTDFTIELLVFSASLYFKSFAKLGGNLAKLLLIVRFDNINIFIDEQH